VRAHCFAHRARHLPRDAAAESATARHRDVSPREWQERQGFEHRPDAQQQAVVGRASRSRVADAAWLQRLDAQHQPTFDEPRDVALHRAAAAPEHARPLVVREPRSHRAGIERTPDPCEKLARVPSSRAATKVDFSAWSVDDVAAHPRRPHERAVAQRIHRPRLRAQCFARRDVALAPPAPAVLFESSNA
jgi:hypothetical protein